MQAWIAVVVHEAAVAEPSQAVAASVNVHAPASSQLVCAAARSAAVISASAHAAIGVATQLWAVIGAKFSACDGALLISCKPQAAETYEADRVHAHVPEQRQSARASAERSCCVCVCGDTALCVAPW